MLNQREEKDRRRTESSRRLQPCEVVRFFLCLWYYCGQTKNHRQFGGDFSQNGGPEGDRTLEPHGCEPCALPAELRAHITAFCPFFRTKSGVLKLSVLMISGGFFLQNCGPTLADGCASISMRTVRSPRLSYAPGYEIQ